MTCRMLSQFSNMFMSSSSQPSSRGSSDPFELTLIYIKTIIITKSLCRWNQPVSLASRLALQIILSSSRFKQQSQALMSFEQKSESFYSLDQSKSEFTFVAQPASEANSEGSSKMVNQYGIKQSSALVPESSQNEVNQSLYSIVPDGDNEFEGVNMHDISQINLQSLNQLECSACLEREIDCLTVPNDPSKEDILHLQRKIETLKNDQSMLRRQIEVFQGLMSITKTNNIHMVKQLMQNNQLMKKKCEHSEQSASPFNFEWPDPSQVSIKSLQEPQPELASQREKIKHYDIKPNLNRSESEQRLNSIYKSASFQRRIVVLDDPDNQYRVQVVYETNSVEISIVNYNQGETNFIYAGRLNEGVEADQKISQKLSYPLSMYREKKFTLSLNILLLFFEENRPKQEEHLIKIEQIRSVSVPLPLCYLVEPRFTNIDQRSFLNKLQSKLHIYEININYGIDANVFQLMRDSSWIKNQWISMRGSQKLLRVQIPERGESSEGANFRVSVKERQAQQAIDMIEYLCFMLTL